MTIILMEVDGVRADDLDHKELLERGARGSAGGDPSHTSRDRRASRRAPLDEIEKEYIVAALALNEGNQTRTAEQLHIGSATLYRKLKSYGLIGSPRTPSSGRRRGSV